MTGENSLTDFSMFEYDPLTGVVIYLTTGRPFCGQVAGHWIKVHRLAWKLYTGEWPKGVIDHKNGDGPSAN